MKRTRYVLLALVAIALCAGGATVGGNRLGSAEAVIDLPIAKHVKNTAGTDGAGLCVWASLQMHANWVEADKLKDIMIQMQKEPGGGWPERVTRKMKEVAPDIPYVQYEGSDPSVLDLAMKTGRPACVTYGYGERYNNQTIAHMVLLAHLDPEGARNGKPLAAIIDNNFPGTWEWMTREEFLKRWKHPNGEGWAVVILLSPPPPIPAN